METQYKGNNRLILGIVSGVVTFWLFAQTMVNIVPAIQADLGISSGILGIAISLTSLFSGMFMVVAGGLADKHGRVKVTNIGMILSIIGSSVLSIGNGPSIVDHRSYHPRAICCVHHACYFGFDEDLLRWS